MEGYTVTILMFLFSGCICLSLGQVPVVTNTRIARPVGVRKYFVVKNVRIARPVRISYTSPTKQTRAPIVPKNPTECQASCPPDTQTLHIDHRQKEEYALDRTACICDGNQCGCCVHLTVARIGLDSVGCVNVTYLPYDMGFDFLMSVDGKTLLSSKVAVRSPPPICVGIPYLHHLASVCTKFQDLKRKDEKLSGCASIMVRFALAVLSEHDLGCFELPKESENTQPDYSLMKILKDRYSRSTDHVLASMYQQLTIDESDLPTGVSSRNCGCNKSSCSCCVHLTLEKVFQDDTGCVHVSYLRSENGFEFKATLNGGNLIDSKDIVSEVGKTSPPFCVTIPSERRPVRMCVIFRDLHLSDLEMFGCASFSVLLASLDVGCFRFSSSTQRQSEVDSGNFSSFIAPGDTGDINFLDIS